MSRTLVISNRYTVHIDQPLPQFNSVNNEAYLVSDGEDKDNALFALRVSLFPPPRYEYFSALSRNSVNNLVNLVDWKIAHWGEASDNKEKVLILIFKSPQGHKIMQSASDTIEPWSEQRLIKDLITPMVDLLSHFKRLGLTHRAIRPDNLYISQENAQLMAGECISMPPGYRQGAVFEPVNLAMAIPYARGNGIIASDLYALGVTGLILHLGYNPWHEIPEKELISHKLEIGSYQALVGDRKIKGRLVELFKNLLADNPEDRWNLESIDVWARQGVVSARPGTGVKRSTRALEWINNKKIYDAHTLSYELRQNPQSSLKYLSEPHIGVWIKNNLSDANLSDFFTGLYENLSGKKSLGQPISGRSILMRACYHLYPKAPILWAEKNIMIDGLANAIIMAEFNQEKIELYHKLLMDPALEHYINFVQKQIPEVELFNAHFSTLRRYLINSKIGYGIERCLYTLNAHIFCLSPMILDHCAFNIKEVLFALEKVAPKMSQSKFPVDRHILSFLATQNRKLIQDKEINDLNSPDAATRFMIALRLYSVLQQEFAIPPLPNLCKWFGDLSSSQIKKFQNRQTITKLEENLKIISEKGNLKDLYDLLNDRDLLLKDQINYENAKREYRLTQHQIDQIEKNIFRNPHYLRKLGGKTAVSFASIAGVVYSGLFSLYNLMK